MERVFEVLLKQFGIIARPSQLWFNNDIDLVLKKCFIIQNIAVIERKGSCSGDWRGGTREIETEKDKDEQYFNITTIDPE